MIRAGQAIAWRSGGQAVTKVQALGKSVRRALRAPFSADRYEPHALSLADLCLVSVSSLSRPETMGMNSAKCNADHKGLQMGQTAVIAGSATALLAIWVVTSLADKGVEASDHSIAYAEPEIGHAKTLELRSGSALATAAFGMSALQPETYNGELVIELLKASPLADEDKARLVASLNAAEVGKGDLPSVLADVRTALAIE